jgi:hypothetical protein
MGRPSLRSPTSGDLFGKDCLVPKIRIPLSVAAAATLVIAMLGSSSATSVAAPERSAPRVLVSTDNVQITKSGDWIYFDYADKLGSAAQKTYVGKQDAEGCSFAGSETAELPADFEGVIEEREIARNSTDCIMITEEGLNQDPDLRAQLLAESGQAETETAIEEADPVAIDGSARAAVEAASATRGAIHITFYEDPPGLTVNEAQARLQWRYNGSCVTDSWDHVGVFHWLSGSGWKKDSSSVTASRSCAYAETLTNSRFTNNIFCLTIDTHTRYTPNRIRGQENGSYTMYWDADAWGGCNWLLSFHRYHFPY